MKDSGRGVLFSVIVETCVQPLQNLMSTHAPISPAFSQTLDFQKEVLCFFFLWFDGITVAYLFATIIDFLYIYYVCV